MSEFPTRFSSHRELATLPWFDLQNGELVADPSVGPVIDVHTHLALSFVLPTTLDLSREWPETEHYLPVSSPLDLDVYANVNFSKEQLRALEGDLTWKSLGASGMRRTHTVPNLTREMRGLSITNSVLLAIDFPVLSDNAGDWLKAARGHDELVVFGSVHPYKLGMRRHLDRQVALGARGIKVHPAVQTVLPQDPRAMKLYRLCGERRLPVFFHCGPVGIEPPLGRALTQVRHYEKPIAKNPDTTFVLGHSGALQMETAIRLANEYPNVWLEISSQSLTNVRKLLDQVDVRRVLCGSDWPFYHQALPIAKLLIATEDRRDVRSLVLHENARRLLGLGPAKGAARSPQTHS